MKVLFLCPRYSGGGAERNSRELFERMPSMGVDTRMFVAFGSADDPAGVQSFRLAGERWLFPLAFSPWICDWRYIGSRLALGRLTHKDFDLVHIHTAHDEWISFRSIHDLCQRIPSVWTLHDEWAPTGGVFCNLDRDLSVETIRRHDRRLLPYLPYYPTPRVHRWRRFLRKWMPRPTAVICPSRHIVDLTESHGWFRHSRVHQIIHGLSILDEPTTNMDRMQARRELNLPLDKKIILMVGMGIDALHKGLHLAAEALRMVPNPEKMHLFLLGSGSTAAAAKFSNLTITTSVAHSNAALARAYRAADLTLIPSLCESLSFVALESLACQTPIVGFRVGGLAEIIGDGQRGLVAERFDVTQLREQILRILNDAGLSQSLATNGQTWVRRQCDMASYLRQIRTVYETCAGG